MYSLHLGFREAFVGAICAHMKSFLIGFVSLVGMTSLSHAFVYQLNQKIMNGTSVEFIEHSGPGAFDNYLMMNLPFEPMADLFRQLLIVEKTQLTSRGEAHITVITPVEFWNVLRPKSITMDEINEMARQMEIQRSEFNVVCLGRGTALVEGKQETAYFVVVKSEKLLRIRKEVQKMFVARGGAESDFLPDRFYPHITLGFTKRDLHESDGVVKDVSSCRHQISMVQ